MPARTAKDKPATLPEKKAPGTAIAENLGVIRRFRGLTQAELAAKIDANVTHIARIEIGTYEPSVSIIPKLMEALEVSADELLLPWKQTTELNSLLSNLIAQLKTMNVEQLTSVTQLLRLLAEGHQIHFSMSMPTTTAFGKQANTSPTPSDPKLAH